MIPQTNYYNSGADAPLKLDIESLVNTKLPPSPGNTMRISTLLRDFNTPTKKIIDAISYEPNIVARILRLANSPMYALERSVTSIQTAIAAVGMNFIHDMVMMELASTTFAKEIRTSKVIKTIWQHSLAVALVSRELSQTLKMRGSEEAFTCGLLHDIGKFILYNNDPEGYATGETIEGESEMLRSETARYGYNHAEVGSLVARRWGLPDEVCYSILHHHNPSQSEHPMLVAHLVDIADTIANIHGIGLRKEEESKLAFSESVMKLGFTPEQLKESWSSAEKNLKEVVGTFA